MGPGTQIRSTPLKEETSSILLELYRTNFEVKTRDDIQNIMNRLQIYIAH